MAENRSFRVDITGDGSVSDYLWVDASSFEDAKEAAKHKLMESFKPMSDKERKHHPHGDVRFFIEDEKTGDTEEFNVTLPPLPMLNKLCLCASCRAARKDNGMLEYPYVDGRKVVYKE